MKGEAQSPRGPAGAASGEGSLVSSQGVSGNEKGHSDLKGAAAGEGRSSGIPAEPSRSRWSDWRNAEGRDCSQGLRRP